MARPLAVLQEDIQALSTPEKEELLCSLWEQLDGPADPAADAAWLAEARRRDAEFDQDSADSSPATEVFQRIRAKLQS